MIRHPLFPDISLKAKYHPYEPAEGERGYSLGQPASPAYWEIKEIWYGDADITNFVAAHCEFLFQEFGEDLLNNVDPKSV